MEFIKAKTDYLTGFYVKEAADEIFAKVKAECKINGNRFSVLLMDLDRFRSYNARYGHLDGDALLRYFASTIRIVLEGEDTIPIRFGGDEFIIIFPGKAAAEAYAAAAQLMKIFHRRPLLIKNRLLNISFSAGISSYPRDSNDNRALIALADKAMYFSKKSGRCKITQYNMLWFLRLKRIGFLAGVIILVFLAMYCLFNLRACRKICGTGIKSWIGKVSVVASKRIMLEPDAVYLTSGGIVRGRIIKSDSDLVELQLENSQAKVEIKKSDIKKIVAGTQ